MEERPVAESAASPPSPEHYHPETIRKAVLGGGLKHPLTVYPVALGISGAIVGLLFQLPAVLLASFGLGLAGPVWAVISIFFRHESLGGKYLERLHERQKEYETYLIGRIETGLEECRSTRGMEAQAKQGLDQLKSIRLKFDNIKDLLDMKLKTGEITYGRFLGAAEQVSLSVLDNLKTVAGLLKSAGSIQPGYLKRRLKALAQTKEKSAEESKQEESLRQRLELWENQLLKANRLLAANEEAMTEMEVISAAIAQWRTDRRFSSQDFEAAIARLQELAAQAGDYDA